jgi:hypothetical protein
MEKEREGDHEGRGGRHMYHIHVLYMYFYKLQDVRRLMAAPSVRPKEAPLVPIMLVLAVDPRRLLGENMAEFNECVRR